MNEQILKMVRLFWRFTISVKPVINSVLNWEPRVQTRSKSKLIQKRFEECMDSKFKENEGENKASVLAKAQNSSTLIY